MEDGVREEKKWSGTAVEGESRAHSCEQLFCSLFLHTDSRAQPVHYSWDISLGNKDNTKASKSVGFPVAIKKLQEVLSLLMKMKSKWNYLH